MAHFAGETLFERIARAVCRAGVLPRKELYEAWAVARDTRRRFRGGRVVDLACGHGLLAHIMLVLDDSSPEAIGVDTCIPASAAALSAAMVDAWPRLRGRVHFHQVPLESVPLSASDVVVSAHACGPLTDAILARAAGAAARVAVLPCCHALTPARVRDLEGWVDGALAMDLERAAWLRAQGYVIHTREIPAAITPKNRLLLGAPRGGTGDLE
jgi:SAM-dependent methyltransferase